MSIDDDVELVGESELYDLWIETQNKAREIAERMDLTNEDLERIEARWTAIAKGNAEGHAMAAMARFALTIRMVSGLTALMRPGEQMVPLVELAERARRKGDA